MDKAALEGLLDLSRLEEDTRRAVAEDRLYWLRNDAKIRAATTGTVDYEEFRQRVEAAHLRPLEKKDAIDRSEQKTVWNPVYRRKEQF